MREIIELFWRICLFKKGPVDIPESTGLYGLSVCCYIIASLLITKMAMSWSMAITNSLVGFMLLLGFVWAVLKLHGKLGRFYPTATALFGADACISICSLPLFAAVFFKFQPGVAFLFLVLLMIWSWVVMANILRLALSSSIGVGVALVAVFNVASFRLLQFISGGG